MSVNTPYPCRATKDGVELFVRATPKASKNKIDGISIDADGRAYLKVYVTAPPENSQANRAIIELLGTFLSIPKSYITQKSGDTHRLKSFHLDGISIDEVTQIIK